MAKLNKLLLSKKTEVNSIEYITLIKLVLSTLIWNNKYQQVILDTIEEGVQLPSYECSKEKISLFEPSSLVIYLLNNTVTYKVWQLIEFETSKLKPLVKANLGNSQVYEQIASQLEDLVAKYESEENLKQVLQYLVIGNLYAFVNTEFDKLSQYPKVSQIYQTVQQLQNFQGLVNDLANGVIATVNEEKKQEIEVIVGDESHRKVDPSVVLPESSDKAKQPIAGEKNILITSALPYVNNVPHLGNLIGSTLSADVYARFCKIRSTNYLFICGTDEYGTATETKALELGVTCQELCDKYHKVHKEIYEWFDIDFDLFGRTTTPQQTEIAQDIFLRCKDNGYLLEDSITQLFCEHCQRFLADRYVEGECPKCHYNDARGDQCDQCGGLLNAHELINPRCKLDNNTPVLRESTHVFLDLPKLQPACEEFVSKHSEEGKWTNNGKLITQSWLKEGLRPRCITRDLKWGTPVPLEHLKDKVFYVWFDAPIGYLSITANYTKDWEAWWKNPDNVKLYQFMGKDNVPFHTVIFPCSELGTGENWTLLHHVNTTEYLNYEDGKFSKSRNVGVFGNNAQDTGIPASVWRYYLISNRPETNDSVFSWNEFITRNNSELLNNLGNFCNRVLKFLAAGSKYAGVVPKFDLNDDSSKQLVENVNQLLERYIADMELGKFRSGLRLMMEISQLGNQYLQNVKIDNALFNDHREVCDRAVGLSVNLIYLIAALTFPFMPETTKQMCAQLNAPIPKLQDTWNTAAILEGHRIGKPTHLFTRIEEKLISVFRSKFGGTGGPATPPTN